MPRYEYECETCQHRFEVQQKFSDPPVEQCVRCGKGVRKLISASGLMFKGTGWYVTDYSNKLKEPGSAQRDGSGNKDGAGKDKDGASRGGESERAPAKSESGSTADSSPSAPSPPAAPSSEAKAGPGAPKHS